MPALHPQKLPRRKIVVGSGAGGGPLAARLALAGHNTLLIEAGDDQGGLEVELLPRLIGVVLDVKVPCQRFILRSCRGESGGYEYIVVGSGAGGGPLAARLALAGHNTLLIEAGEYVVLKSSFCRDSSA
jgi:choline dehydrogenase-like flavoprotein